MEEIKNNLPLLSIGLLILGTINIMIYYGYFNIEILSYLDFTEVLQIQFKLFAISGAVLIGLLMLVTGSSFLSERRINIYEESAFDILARETKRKELFKSSNIIIPDEERDIVANKGWIKDKLYYERIDEEKKNKKRNFLFKHIGEIMLGLPALGYGILSSINNISNKTLYNMHLFSIPFFAIFTVIAYLGLRRDILFTPMEPIKLQKRRDLYKAGCLFVFLAYAGGSYARASAIDLVLDSSAYEVSFSIDSTNINTSKSYRFIGKTKSYLFFYDISKKQSDVFKIDDVKNLSIRDGIKYGKRKQDTKPSPAKALLNPSNNAIRDTSSKAVEHTKPKALATAAAGVSNAVDKLNDKFANNPSKTTTVKK